MQAFVLGELLAAPERAEPADARDELPFVDRERERAVLGASVAPVRMGFGTLVELVGEPGIGKSRLAQELRENCADMRQIYLRCEQYEASTPYYPFRPFLRSLLDVQLNGGGEHNRAVLGERLSRSTRSSSPWAPLLAAPLDVEVESTPEVNDLDPSFWRARLHGVMGTLLGQLLDSPDPARLRRRPLDGRRVVRAPALPRNAASDPAVARVHDSAPRRGRIRGSEGHAAAPGTDAPSRAAPRGRREDARARRGGRSAPHRRRARGAHGAGGREPALPPGARERRRETDDAEELPEHGRGARRNPDRPARPGRPRAPPVGLGPRRLVLRSAHRRGSRRRPDRRRPPPRRGTGSANSSSAIPTFREPFASGTRSSATPPTRASRSGGGESCMGASPRSIEQRKGTDPRKQPRSSRSTTTVPGVGPRPGGTRSRRDVARRRNSRTSRRRSSSKGRSRSSGRRPRSIGRK